MVGAYLAGLLVGIAAFSEDKSKHFGERHLAYALALLASFQIP